MELVNVRENQSVRSKRMAWREAGAGAGVWGDSTHRQADRQTDRQAGTGKDYLT
jgi:hypothetical protein